ncbi:MAG: hypothetical protein IE926_07690 [Micrococcales bacterium]|nr:hypothetical protein [Micrococcales bacterium]
MSELGDRVLPLIRTRSDLSRYRAASAHGVQMHEAVDVLERAAETADPAEVLSVTEKAIASALRIVMRADDSAGIIGDACRRLVDLHPVVATTASVSSERLVEWMIRFQFAQECDFFTLDPVAYASALGELGMRRYRARLDEIRAGLGAEPSPGDRWQSSHAGEWFTLTWNAQRLAVHDRDAEAVIRTHLRDGGVPAWYHETAEALEEIGDHTRALEYVQQAVEHPMGGHQAIRAAEYWCELLARHAPERLPAARLEVFRRWPSSSTAARLRAVAGEEWAALEGAVMERLSASPRDAVLFVLLTLEDVRRAWDLAEQLLLDDADAWERLAGAYERIDPLAVLPVLARLVDTDLETPDAQHYRSAARRLARMRRLAAGTERAREVDDVIRAVRHEHRRRPRLQLELDCAGLPRSD